MLLRTLLDSANQSLAFASLQTLHSLIRFEQFSWLERVTLLRAFWVRDVTSELAPHCRSLWLSNPSKKKRKAAEEDDGDEDDDDSNSETFQMIFDRDVIEGLLQMELLPRLAMFLERPDCAEMVLDIFVRVAHHSIEATLEIAQVVQSIN
jgi:hypothetical protein